MIKKERRQKIMYLSKSDLESLIKGIHTEKEFFFPLMSNFPKDFTITNVSFDHQTDAVAISVHSDTFDPAPWGDHLELIELWQRLIRVDKIFNALKENN